MELYFFFLANSIITSIKTYDFITGLDNKTEKCVEESIVAYVKRNGAAVLWVTHSEDIADRILSMD